MLRDADLFNTSFRAAEPHHAYMSMRRFTRLTNALSKKFEAIAIHFTLFRVL